MRAPSQLCLRGRLVVIGKQPDGDSIRFVPDTPALLGDLRRARRIRPSRDGSVQLRLEGIDAPETHYSGEAQPLADPARDRLLELCGFESVRHRDQEVIAAEPVERPAAALAQMADANGRPVALLLTDENLPADGSYTAVDDALLDRTINAALLADGSAYLTLYDSAAPPLRAALRALARDARGEGGGVWGADATAAFELRDQESIGPEGDLVLPKLFRRCTDYLDTRTRGETLVHWLRTHGDPTRPEDDLVVIGGRTTVRLSSLIEQRRAEIAFTADLLDFVFVEK
ncbi:MAG: thermonuclease family protein [Actinomycetota bacterium]|nr:thermonuclease family protein [Actinomycetota bacterium]